MLEENENFENDEYGDKGYSSGDAPIPRWLKYNYIFWAVFGLVWFYFFFNGSYGWLDRGYWQQLQRAANTTFPFNTSELVEEKNQRMTGQARDEK